MPKTNAKNSCKQILSSEPQSYLLNIIHYYQFIYNKKQKLLKQRKYLLIKEHHLEQESLRLEQYILKELKEKKVNMLYIKPIYIKRSEGQPKVIIDNKEAIPEEYVIIQKERIINQENLKRLLLEGHLIPGAHLETEVWIDIYEQPHHDTLEKNHAETRRFS